VCPVFKDVSHLRLKQNTPAVPAVESHINEIRRGMSDEVSRTKLLMTCWYPFLWEFFIAPISLLKDLHIMACGVRNQRYSIVATRVSCIKLKNLS